MVSTKNLSNSSLHKYGLGIFLASIFFIIYSAIYFYVIPTQQTSMHFLFYLVIIIMFVWGIYLIKNY